MKKTLSILLLSLTALCFTSCEIDNYDMPGAAVEGQVYDHLGNPLQTAQGQGNMKSASRR